MCNVLLLCISSKSPLYHTIQCIIATCECAVLTVLCCTCITPYTVSMYHYYVPHGQIDRVSVQKLFPMLASVFFPLTYSISYVDQPLFTRRKSLLWNCVLEQLLYSVTQHHGKGKSGHISHFLPPNLFFWENVQPT